MRITVLRIETGNCPDGKTCPALAATDRRTYLIVGKAVTDPEALGAFGIGDGEVLVEVPASLLDER